MKPTFLVVILFLSSGIGLSKTNYINKYTTNNKFKIGYAYNTFNKLLSTKLLAPTYLEIPANNLGLSFSNVKEVNVSSINFSFEHRLKPKMEVGGTFTTEIYKKTYNTNYNDSLLAIKELTQFYTFMPNIYFHYLDHHLIDLYLGCDFGLILMLSKTKETKYAFGEDRSSKLVPTINVCLFGIQLKSKVSPYFQINVGSRGWLEGGILFNL